MKPAAYEQLEFRIVKIFVGACSLNKASTQSLKLDMLISQVWGKP